MVQEPPALALNRGGTFNPPRDGAAFERLARDLFARLLGNRDIDLNGRTGQRQAGVDICGIDSRTGRRVGVQCKSRSGSAGLSEDELREEVAKALAFSPPLGEFVILTTGPNDAHLKRVAGELTADHAARGLFSVEFHGWDWIEGHLADHVDLAVEYGLVAVAERQAGSAVPASSIAREIGLRLGGAIELMNVGREGDDRFTLQGLARHAGHRDWRRLELIAGGHADADMAELSDIAEALALNLEWLLEGKGAPFCVDDGMGPFEVEDLHAEIMAFRPERIVFVRQREGGHGTHDAFVVVKRDAVRWHVFRETHPACGHVGGTGARQIFDFCRMVRRIDYADVGERPPCFGRHLDNPEFEQLLEGEIYPGSILDRLRNDHWWQAFSALRRDWVHGDEPHQEGLREAIHIARHQLSQARESAGEYAHWRDTLAWGRFQLAAPADAEVNGERWD